MQSLTTKGPVFPFGELSLPYSLEVLEPALSLPLTSHHYDEVYKRDLLYLNSTIAASNTLQDWSLYDLLLNQIRREPVLLQTSAKFYAGSVLNHALYFESMTEPETTQPSGELVKAINKRYGSVSKLKHLMSDAAAKLLCPGWVWLNSEGDGNVHIAVTRSNDVPQLSAVSPIFTVDTWEHAYMPQYSVHIDHYVDSWFTLLDWDAAEKRFEESLKRGSSKKPSQSRRRR